jgi:hypothetical protein
MRIRNAHFLSYAFLVACGGRLAFDPNDASQAPDVFEPLDASIDDVTDASSDAGSCAAGIKCAMKCLSPDHNPGFSLQCLNACSAEVCPGVMTSFKDALTCINDQGIKLCWGKPECLEMVCGAQFSACRTAPCN